MIVHNILDIVSLIAYLFIYSFTIYVPLKIN